MKRTITLQALEIQTELALQAFNLANRLSDENVGCPHYDQLKFSTLSHYESVNELYISALKSEIESLALKLRKVS